MSGFLVLVDTNAYFCCFNCQGLIFGFECCNLPEGLSKYLGGRDISRFCAHALPGILGGHTVPLSQGTVEGPSRWLGGNWYLQAWCRLSA